MANRIVKHTQHADKEKKTTQLQRDAAYSAKLLLIFSEGSPALKIAAEETIDALLDRMKGAPARKAAAQYQRAVARAERRSRLTPKGGAVDSGFDGIFE